MPRHPNPMTAEERREKNKEKCRNYWAINRTILLFKQKRRRAKKRKEIIKYNKSYYQKNKDTIREKNKRYYYQNRELILAKGKKKRRLKREKNERICL